MLILVLNCRHERAGNEQFVTETSKWVFHERGHLKVLFFLISHASPIFLTRVVLVREKGWINFGSVQFTGSEFQAQQGWGDK
jgi:hypothetical protein